MNIDNETILLISNWLLLIIVWRQWYELRKLNKAIKRFKDDFIKRVNELME